MVYTVTYTEADLATVDAAILAGGAVSRLKFGETEVEFRSMADLLKWRAFIAQSLAAADQSSSGYRLAATSKGA